MHSINPDADMGESYGRYVTGNDVAIHDGPSIIRLKGHAR